MRLHFYLCAYARLAVVGSFLLCARAFSVPVAAQAPVDLAPHWKIGDRVDYVLTKHGVVADGLRVVVDTTNTTPIRVDVLKAGADGYVIGWTQGVTQFDSAAAASMNPVMKKMAELMVGRRLELRLDRTGRVQAVTNWEEIRNLGEVFARDVSSLLAQSRADAVTAAQATAQIRAIFESERSIRLASTREVQLLLFPLGHVYEHLKPVQVEVVAPNPAGPGQVQATQQVEIQDVPGRGVSLRWTQPGAPVHVSGDAVIEVATGWPFSISQTVEAPADGARRTETTSLQRK